MLTAPAAVFAYSASGACSFHSGVNCSAGAHVDGSAICNDGWVDSSVKYYEVQECSEGTKIQCPTPHVSGYSEYSSCESIQDECTRYNEQRKQTCVISGRSLDSANCQPLSCEEADMCRDDVKLNKQLVKSYNQCLDNAVSLAEAEFERQKEINRINEELLQVALKEASCGSFAYYSKSDDNCYCEEGYEVSLTTGQCSLKKIEAPIVPPVLVPPTVVKESLKTAPTPIETVLDLEEESLDSVDSDTEAKSDERTQEILESLSSSTPTAPDIEVTNETQEDVVQKEGIFTKIINFLSKLKFW